MSSEEKRQAAESARGAIRLTIKFLEETLGAEFAYAATVKLAEAEREIAHLGEVVAVL